MKNELAILGLGRFGELAASVLKHYFRVVAFDTRNRRDAAVDLGIPFVSLEEAASKDVLLLTAPISATESLAHSIAPHVREGALICDTCSVKVKPLAILDRVLPSYVQILGTHPCFGPDSVRPGFEGNKIVLCPVRVDNVDAVKYFMTGIGLTVIMASPEEHDRAMAQTQAIAHFLGRAVQKMGLKQQTITTDAFSQLLEILQYVQNDTEELFRDLQMWNPYSKEMRLELIGTLKDIHDNLENGKSW